MIIPQYRYSPIYIAVPPTLPPPCDTFEAFPSEGNAEWPDSTEMVLGRLGGGGGGGGGWGGGLVSWVLGGVGVGVWWVGGGWGWGPERRVLLTMLLSNAAL